MYLTEDIKLFNVLHTNPNSVFSDGFSGIKIFSDDAVTEYLSGLLWLHRPTSHPYCCVMNQWKPWYEGLKNALVIVAWRSLWKHRKGLAERNKLGRTKSDLCCTQCASMSVVTYCLVLRRCALTQWQFPSFWLANRYRVERACFFSHFYLKCQFHNLKLPIFIDYNIR